MLTCPPTQLGLTASDIADFELRLAAQEACNARLRLRLGAGRLAKLGFVPAHANTGRKRAESRSSQATICETSPVSEALSTVATRGSGSEEHDGGSQTHSPRAGQSYDAGVEIHTHRPQSTNSHTPAPCPLPENRALRELDNGVHNLYRLPLRLRGPPTNVDPDLAFVTSRSWLNRAPEPMIIEDPQNASMDPDAPVFVPRTRFGSTTSMSAESRHPSTSANIQLSTFNRTDSFINLRARSTSERNAQHVLSSPERQDSAIGIGTTTGPGQGHHRARINDQNATIWLPALSTDRYPIVQPLRNTSSSSRSQRQVVWPRHQSSRHPLINVERSRRQLEAATQLHPLASDQHAHLTVPIDHGQRPVSPALSTSSRSTPNLFHAPTTPRMIRRSSSLSWRDHVARPRAPAVEASEQIQVGHNSNLRALGNAFEQQWLNRDSPLDELAYQLDRLAARPRSVGRSFEQTPENHGRLSLLTGDPFQMDRSTQRQFQHGSEPATMAASRQQSAPNECLRKSSGAVSRSAHDFQSQISSTADFTTEDPVALALALPSPTLPSSPEAQEPSQLLSAPLVDSPALGRIQCTPREILSSPMLQPSSGSATPSSLSLSATATPAGFHVYDDSKPQNTQPKTPADLVRTARRSRDRSDTTPSSRNPVFRPAVPTPPQVAVAHRYTYPTMATPERNPEVTSMRPSPAYRAPETTLMRLSVSTRGAQRSSGSSENDIEGNLEGLEEDRRTWMRRRGDGTLDVTPPREGRFERYLS